ncbi:MAG TPA: hypothetical protein DEG47_13255, partial [Cyanobacteria bacterium UBA11148]|nr:hypothetical protein [Cyanobacteria bacterium UBA11148]
MNARWRSGAVSRGGEGGREGENGDAETWGCGDAGNFSLDITPKVRSTTLPPSHPLPPSIPNLWLVIAQDTTEQKQVAKELAAKNAD